MNYLCCEFHAVAPLKTNGRVPSGFTTHNQGGIDYSCVIERGVYTMAKVLGFPPAARKLIINAEVEVDD